MALANEIGLLEGIQLEFAPAMERWRQHFFRGDPAWVIPADMIADLALKGLRDYDDLQKLALTWGLNADQFRLMVDARRPWLTGSEIMDAQYRGYLEEDEAKDQLAKLGYDDTQRYLIKRLSEFIPQAQDVIRFFQRDAFIPEFVERFGMDKEQPPDARQWFAKLGIDQEIQTLFWRAHWELPSVSQGYEMLWRNQIDKDDLLRLMRAQGVEPYWREKLINVAYSPLRLVDIRRFFKDGVLSRDAMVEQFKFRGYSAENAELSAQWTEKWAHGETAAAKKDLVSPLRTAILHDIVRGTVDEHDGLFALKDLGVPDEEADVYLRHARIVRDQEVRALVVKLHGELHVKGYEDKATVTRSMKEHGLNDKEIEVAFSVLDIEKKLKAPSEHQFKERELTTGEVTASYIDDLVTRKEAEGLLAKLRHSAEDVKRILDLADYKKVAAQKKEKIAGVEADVISGKLDEEKAMIALDSIPIRPTQRNALVAKWFRTKQAKRFILPLTTIEALFVKEIRNEVETHSELLHHGMSEKDATDVLALWGGKLAAAKIRTAKEAAKAG